MSHPLNAPRFAASGRDASREVVVAGYGILQPRVSVSLPGTNRSRYARLSGGEPGIDPYTRTVSDVYQDAFGEGSFIGKGIYDVDAFERKRQRFGKTHLRAPSGKAIAAQRACRQHDERTREGPTDKVQREGE